MRTTLELDDDVLELAKSMAAYRRQSLGKVISEVFRKNLKAEAGGQVRNGVPVIPRPKDSTPVTLDIVNRLRDEI